LQSGKQDDENESEHVASLPGPLGPGHCYCHCGDAEWRALTLSPVAQSPLDWHAGGYLFVLAAVHSLPLWIDSLWGTSRIFRPVAVRVVLAGLAFAAILILRSRQSLDFIYFQF